MELLVWLGFCVGVGYFASSKGRNGFGWGFLAFLISPIIAVIILACTKDLTVQESVSNLAMDQQHLKDRVVSNERETDFRLSHMEKNMNQIGKTEENFRFNHATERPNMLLENSQKFCPACSETIKKEALKCKHCGIMIDEFISKNKRNMINCPFCFEETDVNEIKCFHCGSEIV